MEYLRCPECKFRIKVSVVPMDESSPLECPNCKLVFSIVLQ
ncbi:putative small ZnF protein [Bolahun virus]|uniref:Putative small ZnF protein n=2 Tax=Riboviria TaxID=2559587 RepID=A0A1C9U5D8_9MONO|nr:putative small ZnF protein [Bolahun virus variant 2]AOR51371.1 putative small ZnF protein [Bolahun virus variant 1]AOR51377.1 putative small ZnF protein [Bolahun virus variant 2]